MKIVQKVFSITMVACMVFLEIAPALPAQAANTGPVSGEVASSESADNSSVDAPLINWSETDWDVEVVLSTEMESYQKKMRQLLNEDKNSEAKNLKPKKVKMSSDEAMEYYHVPADIRAVVIEYRDGTGIFIKKNKDSKTVLKSYIESLLSPEVLANKNADITEDHFLDLRTAPKLNIKNIKADNQTTKPVEVKIKSRQLKVKKNSLQNVTIRGIERQVKQKGMSGKKISVQSDNENAFAWLVDFVSDIFSVPVANAATTTNLITYYNGIEKNTLDNALYYISNSQNSDGSFAQVSKYEETGETALTLADVGRTDSTQFSSALNYLINTAPNNNREKAIKARLMVGLSQPYQTYLDQFIASENSDHGYGIDTGFESDILTTMEGALAMYSANYSIQDKLPLSLYYVLNHIPTSGALKYTNDGPVSYYLINKIAQGLYPFRSMTVANDQGVSISVQTKINSLLSYLSSQYDDTSSKLLGTSDVIDEMMTLKTWKLYNVETSRQKVLETKLTSGQYVDGSFGGSMLATVYGLQTLDKPDLALSSLQSSGTLQSRQAAVFSLSVTNNGYAPATNTIIYIFADNVYTGMTVNLGTAGVTIDPNETVNLNLTIPSSQTNSFTGSMDLKFYAEPSADVNFDNNWIYGTFTFSPASDGTPALPMYYSLFKFSLNGNPAIIATLPAVQKTDPNRSGYILMYRERGTTSWQMSSYNPSLYIIGYFPEGSYYEFTIGVLNAAGTSVTYFNDITTVHLSANDNLYTGSASGRVTLDNSNFSNAYVNIQAGLSTTTDQNGEFKNGVGQNGKLAAWVDLKPYEQIRNTFKVQEGVTTPNIRIFTHLKPDTTAPVLTNTELRYAATKIVKTMQEYTLISWGTDNVAIKYGDFYLWNPAEGYWSLIGSKETSNGSNVDMKWTVPQDLPLISGYKIKGVLYDYRGNVSNAVEWGPFQVVDGTPPKFTITSPNGGENLSTNSTTTITWNTEAFYGVSKVYIYAVYPNNTSTIKSAADNTGSFDWFIPNNGNYVGDKVRIYIQGSDATSGIQGMDYSDNYFSIRDSSSNPTIPWSNINKVTDVQNMGLYRPSIPVQVSAYDKNGKLHLVYKLEQDVSTDVRVITQRLYYQTKENNVWSIPEMIYENVTQTDSNLTGYQPIYDLRMITDDNAIPHITWRSASAGGCQSLNNNEIFYMSKISGSWSVPENISNNNTESYDLDMVQKNNNIFVTWVDGRTWDSSCSATGTRKIYLRQRSNNTWSSIQQPVNDSSFTMPRLAVTDDSLLHLVYFNSNEKMFKQSVYNSSWSSPEAMVSSTYFNYDYSLSAIKGGKLAVLFNEYVQDPLINNSYRARVMLVESSSTNQWFQPVEVSTNEKDHSYYMIAVAGDTYGDIHIVMEDYDSPNNKDGVYWKVKSGGVWTIPQKINFDSQYIGKSQSVFTSNSLNKLFFSYIGSYSFSAELFGTEADLTQDYLPPRPITGLTATTSSASVVLNWQSYTDVYGDFDHFEIYRSNSPEALLSELMPVATLTDKNVNSYTDNVSLGSYYYIVATVDRGGHKSISGSGGLGQGGNWLGPIEVTSNLPPAVGSLSGVAVYRGVQLSWATSSDPGVIDYYVEYKKSSDNTFKLSKGFVTTTPSAKIGGLTDYGNTYQFRVAAVSSFGTGTWSNTIDINVPALPLIIFDGNSGTGGWFAGSGLVTLVDDPVYGKVASLAGSGLSTQFGLYNGTVNQAWVGLDPFVSWDMKYSEDYYIFFYVTDINNQNYYIRYSPTKPSGKSQNYAYINLSASTMSGNWQHIYRNLQLDLNSQFPGVQIRTVNYALIHGSGLIDNMTIWPLSQENLGGVSGVVKDSSGNPLLGAKVTLLPNNLIYTTDVTGAYSFPGLSYGSYQLKAEKDTYTFTLQNLTVDSTINKNVDLVASTIIQPPTDIEIFAGNNGLEGWYTGGTATITIQYEDITHGNVAKLAGNGLSSNYILLNSAKQNWNLPAQYVSWEQNFNEDYVVFVYVNTNQGNYYLRYSPRTANGKSTNYTYIKLDESTRNGTWQLMTRDILADLRTQFPTLTINKINYMQVNGSGKIDNVKVLKGIPSLGSVSGYVKDSTGNVLSGAKLTLTPGNQIYTTDATGYYSFASLPYGSYQLKIEKDTYDFSVENVSINSNNPVSLMVNASSVKKPLIIFSGESGTIEGWYTGGTATVTLQYEDAVHGNVAKLAGNALASNYILLNNAKQYWNTTDRYVSWDMNYTEEYVILLYVNTNQGKYYLRYSPRTANGKSTNYAYIKLDESTRNGTWQTITRDIQADLNTQFPSAVITSVMYMQVNGSGKMDNVKVLKENQELGTVAGYVKDSTGNVLSGAKLTLTPGNQIYTTDATGYYSFASLPYGSYTLTAEKDSYEFASTNVAIASSNVMIININALSINKPMSIFSGESGTIEGWYTGGTATITLQYEDATHGNVAQLVGSGLASNYILLNSAKQYWNTANRYVSWDMNYTEDYVVLLYVNTNQGKYYVRYSPRTANGKYLNYAYIKLDASTRDGNWHNIVRDVQADLNTQFPDAIISNIMYMQVNGSGKIDNVLVYREQDLGSVFGIVKDSAGSPLSGVLVTLDPGSQIYTTDATGRFGFASLPYGDYAVKAEKLGVQFVEFIKNININSTSTNNIEFTQVIPMPISVPIILTLPEMTTSTDVFTNIDTNTSPSTTTPETGTTSQPEASQPEQSSSTEGSGTSTTTESTSVSSPAVENNNSVNVETTTSTTTGN